MKEQFKQKMLCINICQKQGDVVEQNLKLGGEVFLKEIKESRCGRE